MSNKYWQRYEKGLDYIGKKSLIHNANKYWNFYIGKQWEGIETDGEDLPFLNFIKPVVKHRVSIVAQNNMVAKFSDAEGRSDNLELYQKLNKRFESNWERANMEMNLWEIVKDAAITGDGIAYFGSADIRNMQRLDATQVLWGDENSGDVQSQPYIIIYERRLVKDVKAEALKNGVKDIEMIVPDEDKEHALGNADEVGVTEQGEGRKVTCITYMEKINGIVNVAKATKGCVYQELHPIVGTPSEVDALNGREARAMRMYPLVKYSWEDYPNQMRGESDVRYMINNQLEINKTLARRSVIINLTAYPRMAYDVDAISNPEALTKVGVPIEVRGGGVQSVNQMVTYLNPATSNNEPKNYADDLLAQTQELSGAGETAMGNINPSRVAATAIIAIRDQAAAPLNEQAAKMKTFVEEWAMVTLEVDAVYNPNGFTVVYETEDLDGNAFPVQKMITKEELDEMKPDIRIDTSQDNPWTKEAQQAALDALLERGHITFDTYLNVYPDNGALPKNQLKEEKKKQDAIMRKQMLMQQNAEMLKQQNAEMENYNPQMNQPPR